ncbi:MAG: hypothetical protein BWY36_00379 [Candidatus Diapherotrites archaeon ADurb.Bin253]|nr:MAG: hypothetical protein BWY36_00379 [Candidatus Diapherotrites archaeon ADurb.Bin253]HNZ52473.1 hypothetical protein [Candidatus Pacearchaeota archaeon]HQC61015.1 hypothetical protein [Candidatus Pacearchaeota archaeon]
MKRPTKKQIKSNIITLAIIIIILIIAILALSKKPVETDEKEIKCIASKTTLYTQLGCHACESQRELFGNNYKYLNVIDCWYERDKCNEIEYTPTWIINQEKVVGVQTIEKLKELTGC